MRAESPAHAVVGSGLFPAFRHFPWNSSACNGVVLLTLQLGEGRGGRFLRLLRGLAPSASFPLQSTAALSCRPTCTSGGLAFLPEEAARARDGGMW
mmetsp:Transcript_30451/g.86076  ORF Transcript_30451/g.86076 Transcript_30451/m.86076 type:complete len:96 (+) Transcript_30451:583-870(+)